MSTRLTKPVTREIITAHTTAPMMVTMTQLGIVLRAKGSRTSFVLPWELAYLKAAQIAADRKVAERNAGSRARTQRVSRGLLATSAGAR